MSDERFEERLRRTPLAAPGEEVREGVLASAGRRRGGRGTAVTWGLAAAAAALIAVNVAFGQVHEARMARLVGAPAPAVEVAHDARWAEAVAERQELLRELGATQPDGSGGEEHEQRSVPDLHTYRPRARQALA